MREFGVCFFHVPRSHTFSLSRRGGRTCLVCVFSVSDLLSFVVGPRYPGETPEAQLLQRTPRGAAQRLQRCGDLLQV